MELFEAISKRYSYRGEFVDSPVPKEDLKKIVQAGIVAPSGCNAQSTTFVIVDDPALLDQIGTILSRSAPAMIVCIANPAPVVRECSFEKEDCAAAVENMLLAITAMGYASVWLDGILRVDGIGEKIGEILGVPSNLRVQIVLPLGIPVSPGMQREKKSFNERAWFNSYGG